MTEMGFSSHVVNLIRSLYSGQEATVRTESGDMSGLPLAKEFARDAFCHHICLMFMLSTSCGMHLVGSPVKCQ